MNSHILTTVLVLLLLVVLTCVIAGLLLPEPKEEPTGLVPVILNTMKEYYDTSIEQERNPTPEDTDGR